MAVNRTIGIVPMYLQKMRLLTGGGSMNHWVEASDSVRTITGFARRNEMGGGFNGRHFRPIRKPGQLMDMGTVASTFNAGRFRFPFGLSVKRRVFHGQPNRFPM